ncbi:MAG: hypothetical protein ABSB76_30350, partial [Streptosporangiaceae bacterium]
MTSASPGGRNPGTPRVREEAISPDPPGLDVQLGLVARGDPAAFDAVYEQIASSVFGIVRRVIRDPAQ